MFHKKEVAFKWAVLLIIIGALLYCSWPLGFVLNPKAMNSGLASELGAVGQPYDWLFAGGDILSGLLLMVASGLLIYRLKLKHWAKFTLLLLGVYGICGALDASIPLQCLPSQQVCGPVINDPLLILHGIFDLIGSAALIGTLVAAWAHVNRHSPEWLSWIYVIGWGGTLFAVLSGWLYIDNGPGYWAQRYYITLSCIWVISLPFVICLKRSTMRRLSKLRLVT